MFGQTQQTNLFGQQSTSTGTQSLFTQQIGAGNTTNIFSKPATGDNSFFTGGTQQSAFQQQQSTGFYKQPDTISAKEIFNKPSTSLGLSTGGPMFSNIPSTTTHTMTSNIGFPQPGISTLSSMSNINTLTQMSQKKEIDKQEIFQIILNYFYAIFTQSPSNQFKIMVYNRIDPRQQSLIRQQQEYKQKQVTIDGKEHIFVDYNLWNTSLQKNPNPAIYYPFQLNGPKNLLTRATITNSMQRYAFEYIIDYQKKINNCRYIYDVEIQDNLATGKKKLSIIKKSLIAVISKLEKLAIYSKRAEKEYNLESNLIQKYNQIKSILVENDSIVQSLEDISSKTSFFNQFSRKDIEKQNLSKEKFQKNLLYFKELKNVFDTTYETLNSDYSVLSFIQTELENTKKYGINNY